MDGSREQALLALEVITGSESDDTTAQRLGTHEAAAEAMSVLAWYLLQALAIQRGEEPTETARFIERSIRGGPDDGPVGVPARI